MRIVQDVGAWAIGHAFALVHEDGDLVRGNNEASRLAEILLGETIKHRFVGIGFAGLVFDDLNVVDFLEKIKILFH